MSELIGIETQSGGPQMELIQATLSTDFLGTPAYFWLAFLAVVIGLLTFDLGVLHSKNTEIEAKESFKLYACYVAIGVLFGAWVWWARGPQSGLEFYTGYIIEQSLAMDNVFVIATIFSFLAIPRQFQHRVLFWGILGVIVFRAIFIGLGAALVTSFSWILFLFGAFLVFTGINMFRKTDHAPNLDNNIVLKWLRSRFPITQELHGNKFLVKQKDATTGKLKTYLTPLLVALILVEAIDIVFAVDSVPAVFAVTQDTFIVYTSNIFAILGLRSLYFALAAAMHRFAYLQTSLAIILVLVGIKIFLVPLGIKIDTLISLFVTVAILASGILYSLWKTKDENSLNEKN
jgi:tellurite resistance protein TerC